MRSNRWAYIAVVAGLIVGMLALLNRQNTVQAQANRVAVVWEYKILYWSGGDPTDSLNELGKKGWELVTTRGYGDEPQSQTSFCFKRVKP
jgi:hypothetical protein